MTRKAVNHLGNGNGIPQPQIKVVMPSTKLRLEHITYLRNLASGDKKIKCGLPWRQVDRLKLLGLVEEVEVPPKRSDVEKYKREAAQVIARIKTLVEKEDWVGLANADVYALRRGEPRSTKEDRVTKAGLELLRKNEVTVKLQKGCA